jgi:feruloyl esterase
LEQPLPRLAWATNRAGAALDPFDLPSAVVDWIEKGEAPSAVTTMGSAFPGKSRPRWVYPKHAHYVGRGDPEDAASFECR